MFFAAFDGGSHGSAHAVGCEFALLTTIESSELLSRQMTALIWGKKKEFLNLCLNPSVGVSIVI